VVYIRIVIAESAISLAPRVWLSNKKIRHYYDKYHRMPLVDGSLHQHLLADIPLEQRNDRPDILHFGLLTVLGYASLLPDLNLNFSTSGGDWYHVDSATNLPRSQNRFYGIVEQLLANTYKGSFISKTVKPDLNSSTVIFSSEGSPLQSQDLKAENFVFGGFAHGDYQNMDLVASPKVRLYPHPLDLWTALSLFINKYLELHDYKT